MLFPEDIMQLYSIILYRDVLKHSLSDEDMKAAIGNMQQVYRPEHGSLSSSVRRLADYSSINYRCAYLHKYAPLHTAMVGDFMRCILQKNEYMFRIFQKRFTRRKQFKICSLGGGPGCDIVGVLVAMFEHFGPFRCSAKVIDIKSDWRDTLASVIEGLSSGMYGPVGECFTQRFLNWDYLTADLLEEMQDDVKSAIGSAEMVTMVKFVSAAACESTEWMLKKIFTMLKLGAIVLFIDNASGGFRQLVSKASTDCNLTSVCGPINYEHYTNESFKITRWNYTSCYSTTVTVHMMQKLHPSPQTINVTSKIIDLVPKSNKHSNVCGNDKPIQKEFLIPSSSCTLIRSIITSTNSIDNSIRNDPTTNCNGKSPQKKPSIISSKVELTQNKLPVPGNKSSSKRIQRPTTRCIVNSKRKKVINPSFNNNTLPKVLTSPNSSANVSLNVLGNIVPTVNNDGNPIRKKLPITKCNGKSTANRLPTTSNITSIQNKPSTLCSTRKPIRKELLKPSTNFKSSRNKLSTPSSYCNTIPKQFPIFSRSGNADQSKLSTLNSYCNATTKQFPIFSRSGDANTIPKQSPTFDRSGNAYQSELSIASRYSIPIQVEHTIFNELPKSKHDYSETHLENRNAIQNKIEDKCPVRVFIEKECLSPVEKNMCATKDSIQTQIQTSHSNANLPSKTDNGHSSLKNDISYAIVDAKSKEMNKTIPSNQSDCNEFTIMDDFYNDAAPTTNQSEIYATEVSRSRYNYTIVSCQDSSPNLASTSIESSKQVSAEIKTNESLSSYTPCDVVLDIEASELEENINENDSVEKLISSVFNASKKSLSQAKTCTSPSSDAKFKCSWCCTIL